LIEGRLFQRKRLAALEIADNPPRLFARRCVGVAHDFVDDGVRFRLVCGVRRLLEERRGGFLGGAEQGVFFAGAAV